MTMNAVLLPLASVWVWPLSWACVAAALVWWLWPRASQVLSQEVSQVPSPLVSERGWESAQGVAQTCRTQRSLKGPSWLPWFVVAVVTVLAVVPQGGWSGYAALALQSPSLLSVTWAVVVLLRATGAMTPARPSDRAPALAWLLLCALGWCLTIDTLNLWPHAWDVGLYAWGFSAAGLWVSAGLVMLLAWRQGGRWLWQAVALLAVYTLLRWPSGNVWDAWLDPVVWICAHVHVGRHAWRWVRGRLQR
jgi:hypothetical protein